MLSSARQAKGFIYYEQSSLNKTGTMACWGNKGRVFRSQKKVVDVGKRDMQMLIHEKL